MFIEWNPSADQLSSSVRFSCFLSPTVTLRHYCHIFWFARTWTLIIYSPAAVKEITSDFWSTVTVTTTARPSHSVLVVLVSRNEVVLVLKILNIFVHESRNRS